MSIACCCKTAGITIRVPLNIMPCVVVFSSFFTALNAFIELNVSELKMGSFKLFYNA